MWLPVPCRERRIMPGGMHNRSRQGRIGAALGAALFFLCPCVAEEAAGTAKGTASAPVLPALGFCRLSVRDVPEGLESLGDALPRYWIDQLPPALARVPPLEANVAKARAEHEKKIIAAEKKLSDAITARDNAWIRGTLVDQAGRTLGAAVIKARRELSDLRAESAEIPARVARSLKPLEDLDLSLAAKGLIEAVDPAKGPGARATAAKADILVWGELRGVEGTVVAHVEIWDAGAAASVFSDSWPLDPGDPSGSGAALADRFMPWLLGYSPGGLQAEHDDPAARIRLVSPEGTDMGAGIGSATWKWLRPGAGWQVIAHADGAYSERRTLEIREGRTETVTLHGAQRDPDRILLKTDPPGASVLDGVAFLGFTPLEVDLARTGGILVLRMKGWDDKLIPAASLVPEDGNREVTVAMVPSLLDRKTELEYRRGAFYDALGIFSLSVGAFLLSSGALAETPATAGSLHDVYLQCTLGSAALGALLFGNMSQRLQEYIGAADAADGS